MRRTQSALAILAFAAASCTTAPVTEPVPTSKPTSAIGTAVVPSLEAETARLNEWFEVKFTEAVTRSPMTATFLGSRENYGKWDDVSSAAQDAEMAIQRANVAEMKAAFEFDNLDHQGQLSYRLAEYELEQLERADKWRGHSYAFNQMFGAQSRIPSFLIAQHKVDSKADAEAYIARLEGVETFLSQHIDNAKASAANGIRPPLFVYEFVLGDATDVVTGYPFEGSDMTEPSPLTVASPSSATGPTYSRISRWSVSNAMVATK